MPRSLQTSQITAVAEPLRSANKRFASLFPGPSDKRQPIHTVYGGAQLFKADTAPKIGAKALAALEEHAPTPVALAQALGMNQPNTSIDAAFDEALWDTLYQRLTDKLTREAVEDFRIDFEDGYGNRPDNEEDAHAEFTARECIRGMDEGTLPPFIGIRIKPLNAERQERAIRTLDVFLSTLLDESGGRLPDNFVVTLPKITIPEQAQALADLLTVLEAHFGLPLSTIPIELMVETPQSIIDKSGHVPLRACVKAAQGRVSGAHFGTYDYTAGCQITATHQSMDNPVCDFAKHVMQVSLAGLPIFLSDGATNVMPVGDRDTVHQAWRLSASHIRHSLRTGYFQGWDLHPAQIPVRYATVYAFFLENLPATTERLRSFVDKAAKATLLGDVFDDAATGQGLLNFFLRGMSCGAITEAEAEATGLTREEFQGRSFLAIVERRTSN